MTVDLYTPLAGTIAGGLILMLIGGMYHYIFTLIKLNLTDKKLGYIISELDTLHKDYKKEISKINDKHKTEMTQGLERALDIYDQKFNQILHKNITKGLLEN